MSFILGNENLYMIVISLIGQESIHILYCPLFFGANTRGTTHGLRLSQINPFCTNSCICLYNSLPRINSIWWMIFVSSGNPLGTLSHTISRNLFNISSSSVDTSYNSSIPFCGIIEKSIFSYLISYRNSLLSK